MNKFELCGWAGALLVLIAYYMVSTEKVKADSRPFQLINILGALLLVFYTYNCQAYASMIVNIIWIGIGLRSISKVIDLNKLKIQGRALVRVKAKVLTIPLSLLVIITSSSFSSLAPNKTIKSDEVISKIVMRNDEEIIVTNN